VTTPEADDGPDAPAMRPSGVATAGRRIVAGLVALAVFTATFWAGVTINGAVSADVPSRSRRVVPPAVEPAALPARTILLPGIPKPAEVSLRTDVPQYYVVDKRGLEGGSAFKNLGLPFAVRQLGPQGWQALKLEESSYAIYREVLAGTRSDVVVDILIAAHLCRSVARCQADHAEFDRRWTKRFHAAKPATRKDALTWYTETRKTSPPSYALSTTRIFRSPTTDSWWLVGVSARTPKPQWIGFLQANVNDIRTQTT
jgi:hypothetical protein